MTKDLGKKLHKAHRDVVFGRKPVVIDSHKLPESQKIYMRRHNEELQRKVKARSRLHAQQGPGQGPR